MTTRTTLSSSARALLCRAWPWLLCAGMGLFTGCGGGSDDSGPPSGTETQSGKVAAAGYVQNAVVFLDLNDNNVLDSNERRTTTDASGSYTLAGLYATDLARHAIVARVFPTSIDVDTGQPVGLDCTIKAPVGRGAFVSPFSTLVSSLMAGHPAMTEATAVAQVGNRLKTSTLPLTAPAQMDLFRDYVADSKAGTPTSSTSPTAGDSRQLRFVAASVTAILSSTTAGLNQRQSLFDANGSASFNAVVTLTEAQLTAVANGTYQFSQLNAAQQTDLIANPALHPNFFINGNDLIAGLVSAINLSDLSNAAKDWVVNSDAFKQFIASLILDLTSALAELLFKVLF